MLLLSMQIVQIIFFVVTWAFFHHLFGGIRHFIWDLGLGFSLKSVDVLSYMTLVLSLLTHHINISSNLIKDN